MSECPRESRAAAAHRPRIIVCGGAGFVGRNLVERLAVSGDFELHILDRDADALASVAHVEAPIRTTAADFASPGDWMGRLGCADTMVLLHARIQGKCAGEFVRDNVTAMRNLLAAARRAGVGHVILVSSSAVHVPEQGDYARTKADQEAVVAASGIPYTILRPTLLFGPAERKNLGRIATLMRRWPMVPVPGHGRYLRQPLFVRDFCDVIARTVCQAGVGRTRTINGTETIAYVDLLRAMRAYLGVRTLLVPIPRGLFAAVLWTVSLFVRDPAFTVGQLRALCVDHTFGAGEWPRHLGMQPTPLADALACAFAPDSDG